MKILKEIDSKGIDVFVITSQSKKRYCGATPDEAVRKWLLAVLFVTKRNIGEEMFEQVCNSTVGNFQSLGILPTALLWELKRTFDGASNFQRQISNAQTIEPKLTLNQRNKLIRLGKYVLGPHYKDNPKWFWDKLFKWTKKRNLDDLTNNEAHYVIKRLEKIEKQLGFKRERSAV